jgi:outer membrane protein OmpA-like peptidoglycan-associated protein
MRQLLLLILFAAAIVGVCYVAVTPVTMQTLAPYSDVAGRMEAELAVKAKSALEAKSLEWASVKMSGQIAILEGVAPREEERAEAIAALRGAAGPGGWMRGGVVAVRDRTTLAPPVSPYEWSAIRSTPCGSSDEPACRVTLEGATPTRAARAELAAYAAELFPGGVADNMIIARGAPDETAWVAVARAAIAQVAILDDGKAMLRDERLTIEGRADDALTRDRVSAVLAQLPTPFLAAARVEAPEADGSADAAVDAGVSLEPITDLAACRALFAELLADADVEFAEGEAAIAKESYPLLDRLTDAATRCEDMSVTITASGEPTSAGEDYVALGLRRAQAITDYFILRGVSQDRLAAQARTEADPAARAIDLNINR